MKHLPPVIDRKLIGYVPSVKRVQALAHSARRFIFDDEATRFMGNFVRNCGDVLLHMVNQPRHGVTSTYVPHHSGLLRGKRHVYAAHSVVSISLTDREYRRPAQALGFATRESPRRHGVRGHFVHYRGREGCVHTWPVAPTIEEDNVPRWECAHCGRLRVWREAFHRGDATKGFTTNEYELTT